MQAKRNNPNSGSNIANIVTQTFRVGLLSLVFAGIVSGCRSKDPFLERKEYVQLGYLFQNTADTNKDGSLSDQEYAKAYSEMGYKVYPGEIIKPTAEDYKKYLKKHSVDVPQLDPQQFPETWKPNKP